MHRLAAVLLAAGLLCGCAHNWTRADTIRQAAVVGLQIIDWKQTRNISDERYPKQQVWNGKTIEMAELYRWEEYNPVLGDHPSTGQVDAYFAGSIVLNGVISNLLPPPYRSWWQYFSIGFEGIMVYHNFDAGIGW